MADPPNRIPTVFDTAHEFDGGSRITLSGLSDLQIKSLSKLGHVWGFLKYHHPAVTGGQGHWDYDLFRILQPMLAARDGAAANQAISEWIANLAVVAECTTCATLDAGNLYLGTNLNWLFDESLLGPDLRQTLRSIYLTRTTAARYSLFRWRQRFSIRCLKTSSAIRASNGSLDFSASYTHDLPGDTFRMLSNDIAYFKLSSVLAAKSPSYIQSAAGTQGLIIDIRNYPSEFVVFSLGSLLVSEPADFVRLTTGKVTNPGAFHREGPLGLTPQQPHYGGKAVILVDEVTQSQAEYTTMALRTPHGAIVIGSTTAGADGDVSTVPLPGALNSYISGIGVFYPDNRPTQRVGTFRISK